MKLTRDHQPKEGNCFVLIPSGTSQMGDGTNINWDDIYKEVISPVVTTVGMTPIRADVIYSSQSLIQRIWQGIQEAEVVVADLTGRDPNVLYALGLAHVIWKSVVLLAMYEDDIPTDLTTQFVNIRYSNQGMGLLHLTRELEKVLVGVRSEPTTEAGLYPLPGGGVEPIPAKVITVTPEFALIETSDGRKGFLNRDDISWSRRVPDLTRYLREGQQLNGAFVSGVKGELKYSLRATADNPWPHIEAKYPLNQEFTGTVVNYIDGMGAFVEMILDVNGFIPGPTIPRGESLGRGDRVKVIPVKIDPSGKKVELRFVRKLVTEYDPEDDMEDDWGYTPGQRFDGTISNMVHDRGFALVEIEEGILGLLHVHQMSEKFLQLFQDKKLEVGTPVSVEITRVDRYKKRMQLRDIPSDEGDIPSDEGDIPSDEGDIPSDEENTEH